MSKVKSSIFIGKDSLQKVSQFIATHSFSSVFLLADENTLKHCYPKLKARLPKAHTVILIKSGEQNKTIKTCETIWKKLTDANADRNSLLINLGGGVIGDMGGFAAGCYKRGIKFINVPTTLLAMVDASVGAKTGIDFLGFKNQIGLFNEPEAVFIYTGFLNTLPDRELEAGFAEVIKHYLIADSKAFHEITKLFLTKSRKQYNIRKMDWDSLVKKNVAIKSKIVSQDKFEMGNRKALNFAHTIGHAMETYFLNRGIKLLHGEAVASGIICESRISVEKGLLPRTEFPFILGLVGSLFTNLPTIRKQSIPAILKLIRQDKKNSAGKNQFTLLQSVGNYSIDNSVEESIISETLEYYSEMTRTYK